MERFGPRSSFVIFIFIGVITTVLTGPVYPSSYGFYSKSNHEIKSSNPAVFRSNSGPAPYRGEHYYTSDADMTENENEIHEYPISPSPRAAYGPVDIIAIHALELITPDPVKTYFNRSFTVMRNHLKDPVPKKKKRPIAYLKPWGQRKKTKIRYKPSDDLDLDDEDNESEEDDDEDDDEYEEEEAYDNYRFLNTDDVDEWNRDIEYEYDFVPMNYDYETYPSRETRFLRFSNLFYRSSWSSWPGHYNNFDRHYYSQYRPMRIHPVHGAPAWKPGY